MDISFEGWDQDLIDEYEATPSDELYLELSEVALMRHYAHMDISDPVEFVEEMHESVLEDAVEHGYSPFDIRFDFEERNVFDETTGKYKKEFIAHYGTPRHSGRYPWGSGKNPQRNKNWLTRAAELEKQGLSQVEVAAAFGMSTKDYRDTKSIYKHQLEIANRNQALKWRDEGHSNTAIAERLGVSEGTVRNWFDERKQQREFKAALVADALKATLSDKPYLDIGEGVNQQLGVSEEQMGKARLLLKDEGYSVVNYNLPQVSNPSQFTQMVILTNDPAVAAAEKDSEKRAIIREHMGEVTSPDGIYFEDYGSVLRARKPIESIDSSRVAVRYAEDGGTEKDGVIEIRPGTDDLALGGRNYAQVRIGVDGTHYLKGMAVYAADTKDWPEGVDIMFNTNKHEGTPKIGHGDDTVLKEMKSNSDGEIDSQNPFGAAFRQWDYQDAAGYSHTSPVNIVNDDEDWATWKKNLSSQFLSKQPRPLIKQQLDIRYAEMKDEFEECKAITNPTLKKEMLEEFADKCDSAAVHLKAAALPRQGAFAILPVTSLKDNEVYAPMYEPGEEVVLIRHPHAGTFEIPRLIVNNGNQEGKSIVGENAPHAIGINSKVAQQLSGADYDGDTVLVIPTKGQKITTDKYLEGLKNFSPSEMYSRTADDPRCTGKDRDGKIGDHFNKGKEMGMVSNLITDMTLKGAPLDDVEKAVKHSMVVIDAEKHNLDWKQSEKDNEIARLRLEWQGKESGGASTLISKASSELHVDEYKEKPVYKMTPEEKERWKNGEVITYETGRTYRKDKKITDPAKMTPEELDAYNRGEKVYRSTGKIEKYKTNVDAMAYVKDAYELSSGNLKENLYAAYANRLKALANEARKEERATENLKENKSAKEMYDDVVGKDGTLAKKILLAQLEYPKERQAQAIATSIMDAKIQDNPELKEKEYSDKRKKLAQKALNDARDIVNGGVHKERYRIKLSDREWEAIQAGAISDTKMRTIIRYSDKEDLKRRSSPKRTGMRASARSRAVMLLKAGWPASEVAKELGVSTTTLEKEGLFKYAI